MNFYGLASQDGITGVQTSATDVKITHPNFSTSDSIIVLNDKETNITR